MTKLQYEIKERGTNVRHLSRKTGIAYETIRNWIAGKNRMPAEGALILADNMFCDVEKIIGDVEEK